jgi:hypothetical protein
MNFPAQLGAAHELNYFELSVRAVHRPGVTCGRFGNDVGNRIL